MVLIVARSGERHLKCGSEWQAGPQKPGVDVLAGRGDRCRPRRPRYRRKGPEVAARRILAERHRMRGRWVAICPFHGLANSYRNVAGQESRHEHLRVSCARRYVLAWAGLGLHQPLSSEANTITQRACFLNRALRVVETLVVRVGRSRGLDM